MKYVPTPRKDADKVKGLSSDIPYVVRLTSTPPDWSFTFPNVDFEQQIFGIQDSDDCWEWSGCEDVSFQIELFLSLKQLPADAMNFLTSNGYFNSQGQLSLSRRFLAILSGQKDNGGDSAIFWGLIAQYGMIPRSMLDFIPTQADEASRAQFDADFYNPSAVTPEMLALGKQFLQYFHTDFEYVGQDGVTPPQQDLIASLYQSPLQIGIPIPADVSIWNSGMVKWDGGTVPAHEVVLYKVDFINSPQFPYFIYDQYFPNLKQLSADYYIYRVTNGVITPILTAPYIPPAQAVAYPTNVFTKMLQSVVTWYDNLFGD